MNLVENYTSEEDEEDSFEEIVASRLDKDLDNSSYLQRKRYLKSTDTQEFKKPKHQENLPKPPEALFNKFLQKPRKGLTEDNKQVDYFVFKQDPMSFIQRNRPIELYFYMDFILNPKIRQSLGVITNYLNTSFDQHDVLLTESKLKFYRQRMSNNFKNKSFPHDSWFYNMYKSDFMKNSNSYKLGKPECFMTKDKHTAIKTYNNTLKSFRRTENINRPSPLSTKSRAELLGIVPLFVNKYGLDEDLHVSISTGALLEKVNTDTHGKEIIDFQKKLHSDISQIRKSIKEEKLDEIPKEFKQIVLDDNWTLKLDPQIVMYPNMYFTKIYFAFKVSDVCFDLFRGIKNAVSKYPFSKKMTSFISLDNLHVSAWVLDLPFQKMEMNAIYAESLSEIIENLNSKLKNSKGLACEANNFKLKRETGDIQTFFFK